MVYDKLGFNITAVNINVHESLNNVSSPRPNRNKTGIVLQRSIRGAFVQPCYRGKAINITCTLVALGIQHAMRMRHIVICGLSATTKMFPHYLIEGTILEK